MLLRTFFKAAAAARDKQKAAVYAACADQLSPALAALLAILEGPNCREVRRALRWSQPPALRPRRFAPGAARALSCEPWLRQARAKLRGRELTTLMVASRDLRCRPQSYKPLLIELALTLPAPLSEQLLLLPKLMRPLVLSLKCGAARHWGPGRARCLRAPGAARAAQRSPCLPLPCHQPHTAPARVACR